MAKNNKSKSGGTGGESSLRTLVDQLRKESIDNGELIVASNFILSNISSNIADMTDHILKMPVIMSVSAASSTSNLSGMEGKAEAVKEADKDNKREESIKSTLDKSLLELAGLRKDLKKGGLLDMILAGAALLAGSVIGLTKQYIDIFKKVFKPLLSLFSSEGKGFASLVDKIKDGWKAFTGIFIKIGDFLGNNRVIKFFSESFSKLSAWFGDIGKVINEAFAGISKVFGGGKEGGFISKIVGFFADIGGKLKYFFKLGEVIGKKILFPIVTIYDTVMGAIEGYEKDGIFGAIKGAFSGLINSIIGGVLDLLKDGVSWVLNALGFENASKALDSFSFQDLITKVVDGFFNFIKGMIDFVIDIFTNPEKALETLKGIGDSMREFGKKVLRLALPTPGGSGIAGWVSKAIPDAVYEYAGMNPKTGETVQETSQTGTPTKALEKTTNENVQAKDAAASTAAAASAAVSNSSSKQTVNNNTTQAAIIKTKTTNWEPDDQWSRGMAYGA
jgi:hypothetical protein